MKYALLLGLNYECRNEGKFLQKFFDHPRKKWETKKWNLKFQQLFSVTFLKKFRHKWKTPAYSLAMNIWFLTVRWLTNHGLEPKYYFMVLRRIEAFQHIIENQILFRLCIFLNTAFSRNKKNFIILCKRESFFYSWKWHTLKIDSTEIKY